MKDHKAGTGAYQCVEPEVGREIWRWAGPDATAAEQEHRVEHLRICDACRLEEAVSRKVSAGLADGRLHLPGRTVVRPRRRMVPALAAGAAGMAAIGLLMMVMLPPTPLVSPGLDRSGVTEGFIRPVEGETVGDGGPGFSWHPVRGAGSYRLRVEEIGGAYTWSGESSANNLDLPDGAGLPAAREFRAYLETVPRDLAPTGGLSVRFRSGDTMAVLRYRAAAAPWPARWLTLSGVLLGLGTVLVGTLGRLRGGAGPV